MKNKYIIINLMFGILALACSERKGIKNDYSNELCSHLNSDSVQTLEGILNISSKGYFVFEDLKYRNEWQRKIHLIPCSENLKKYILDTYDSYLYLKNFEEKFWVSVQGRYTTPDTSDNPPEFIFHFVALMDEPKAPTDSSQALHELVKEGLNENEYTTIKYRRNKLQEDKRIKGS